MRLIIVRHGIAEELGADGVQARTDRERALTLEGVRRMRRGARGLATLVERADVLAASPLVRAQQTADLVAEAVTAAARVTVEALEPERHPREVLAWLGTLPPAATVVCCGHEPNCSRTLSWCITGRDDAGVDFKKGGAARIDFEDSPAAGEGVLRWLLQPSHLRDLAR